MIRDILRKEIEKAGGVIPKGVKFNLTSETKFGDYSSNVGIILGGRNEAEKIKNQLEQLSTFNSLVSKIEIAGPGFLNFYLSEKGLIEGLNNINKKLKIKKLRISLDYLDANPTGPVHLGHARSGFYGDVLANVLEFYGHKVTREFYVNNAKSSGQIQSLGKTALGRGEEYKHEQLLKILKKPEVKKKLKKIKDEKEAGFYIAKIIQKENERFLKKKAKIKYDLFFEEEKIYSSGLLKKIIDKLKKSGATYEKDKALWLKASKEGDKEDRVLIRSTGEPTYVLPDIGYHWDRLVKRKNDLVINIFGADHFGYGPRLKGALESIDIDSKKVKIFTAQMVRLIKDGREFKMSKRKGDFVTLEQLIDEVGLDAVRYFFLMKSLDTHMDFDLGLAKEQSVKNPVYYVQYAGARMASILKKSKLQNPNYKQITISKLQISKPIRNLVLKLIQFPEVIEDTVNDYQVQRLTKYAYELASEFSQFYRDVKVIGSENEKEMIELVFLTRKILKQTLDLLGISAPEKM
ncbi:arginine--tRNA ligase [Patescibacteria group bacterium]|nr:arginine--tRNA ligase [Patescibacteria group bacterium]